MKTSMANQVLSYLCMAYKVNNWNAKKQTNKKDTTTNVLTFAASIEQMATDILFMEGSSNKHKHSITSRAQRYRSNCTSCKIRSLHNVNRAFFCNCNKNQFTGFLYQQLLYIFKINKVLTILTMDWFFSNLNTRKYKDMKLWIRKNKDETVCFCVLRLLNKNVMAPTEHRS